MTEDHVFDLLPGYALGILDKEEDLTVSAHLSVCEICRKELQTYTETSAQLAMLTTAHSPAPDLKEKVILRVNQESQKSAKSEAEISPPGFIQVLANLFRRPAGALAGIALVLVVLFLSFSTFALWQRVNQLQTQVSSEDMQLVRLQGTDNAPEASGYVMVFKDENYGSLAVTHVPQLNPGQQYQIWLIENGKRTSGGVFSVNADGYGVLEIAADRPLDSFDGFGITIEPDGGSPQPTGEKVLGGNL